MSWLALTGQLNRSVKVPEPVALGAVFFDDE